jgi:hypothetical protein
MSKQEEMSISSIGATRGNESSQSRTPNVENVKRVAQDRGDCKITKEKYNKLIESFYNRFNILINEKIRDIKVYCIEEFKKIDNKSNIIYGNLLIHLEKVVNNRIMSLELWLRDMQFIWSFFIATKTDFVEEDKITFINLTDGITNRKGILLKMLDDIDSKIERILRKKYNFKKESRGTHGGRRDTQHKRTPRRIKVIHTRKNR